MTLTHLCSPRNGFTLFPGCSGFSLPPIFRLEDALGVALILTSYYYSYKSCAFGGLSCGYSSWGWARLQSGGWNFLQISHVGGRGSRGGQGCVLLPSEVRLQGVGSEAEQLGLDNIHSSVENKASASSSPVLPENSVACSRSREGVVSSLSSVRLPQFCSADPCLWESLPLLAS